MLSSLDSVEPYKQKNGDRPSVLSYTYALLGTSCDVVEYDGGKHLKELVVLCVVVGPCFLLRIRHIARTRVIAKSLCQQKIFLWREKSHSFQIIHTTSRIRQGER